MGLGKAPPLPDKVANLFDDACKLILLFFGGQACAFIEYDLGLFGLLFLLFGLRNRCDKCDAAATVDYLMRRLAGLVELPVPGRVFVGRIEYWCFKEILFHLSSSAARPLRHNGPFSTW